MAYGESESSGKTARMQSDLGILWTHRLIITWPESNIFHLSVFFLPLILAPLDEARQHSTAGSTFYCRSRGRDFESLSGQILFTEICQEIISTTTLSLPLIHVGLLTVTGKSMGTENWFPLRRPEPAQEQRGYVN